MLEHHRKNEKWKGNIDLIWYHNIFSRSFPFSPALESFNESSCLTNRKPTKYVKIFRF